MAGRVCAFLLATMLVGACSDAAPGAPTPSGAPTPADPPGEPRTSGASDAAGGSAARDGRQPVPRPAALQAWIDRAAEEIGAPTMTPDAVAALSEPPVVLDVRDASEIAVSAMPHAMALSSEAARMEYLHKGGEGAGRVVIVCSTVGWRASHYAQALRGAGMQAYALEGGLCAWAAAGARLVDRQGRPTDRIRVDAEHAGCVPFGCEAVMDG